MVFFNLPNISMLDIIEYLIFTEIFLKVRYAVFTACRYIGY